MGQLVQKKVLIITYYWPPSGGAGVQRWLKFVKYLEEFGWEAIIYTPENPHYPVVDYTLKKDIPNTLEVIKRPIWEPYQLFKKFMGMGKNQKVQHGFIQEGKSSSWKQKLSIWIRGNLFIPDARKFWIKPSIKFLQSYLDINPVDVMVSTGPPHSMHLIANGIRKSKDIPWIADFRDPWTDIDFYGQLMLTRWADRKHKRLEAAVLKNADLVITIGWNCAKGLLSKGAKDICVITNGFDEDDFKSEETSHSLSDFFEIVHVGTMNKDRNPVELWKVLRQLIDEKEEFKKLLRIKLIGKLDYAVIQVLDQYKLNDYVETVEYITHDEIPKHLRSAQILLLALNRSPNVEGIITGKLFEYLAAKRPILCIGSSSGDAAKIIGEARAGISINFDDTNTLKKELLNYFDLFKSNKLHLQQVDISEFSRKELTRKLSRRLDQLVS